MRVVVLGATKFTRAVVEGLVEEDIDIVGMFGIPEKCIISYSKEPVKNYNYAPLKDLCEDIDVPHYRVDGYEDRKIGNYSDEIEDLEPDVILALGWYYNIPKKVRDHATYGAWGIHASLLPKYAGGAPLVWAMINGEEKTGVTLFKMDSDIDAGDVIKQKAFPISPNDYISDVYSNATEASIEILTDVFNSEEPPEFQPQDKSKLEVYPQRKPSDGEIDLTNDSKDLYNFIRAQASLYPGAFIKTIDGKKLIIEKCRIE